MRPTYVLLAALVIVACAGEEDEGPNVEPYPPCSLYPERDALTCDPLAPSERKATGLGRILAIGRDAAGTTYLVDEEDVLGRGFSYRAFLSSEGSLLRHDLTGFGKSHYASGLEDYAFIVELVGGGELTIGVETTDGSTRMAVAPGQVDGPVDAVTAAGEPLEVITRGDLAGMEVLNLPRMPRIRAVLELEDGRTAVSIGPSFTIESDDYQLFIGERAALVQQGLQDPGSCLRYCAEGEAQIIQISDRYSTNAACFSNTAGRIGGTLLELTDDEVESLRFLCLK